MILFISIPCIVGQECMIKWIIYYHQYIKRNFSLQFDIDRQWQRKSQRKREKGLREREIEREIWIFLIIKVEDMISRNILDLMNGGDFINNKRKLKPINNKGTYSTLVRTFIIEDFDDQSSYMNKCPPPTHWLI